MQGTNESKAYERIIDDYNSLMRYVTISRLLCIQIDYFPPIQNANKASERQRENGVVASDPATTSFLEISIAVVSLQAVRSFSSSSSSQLVVAVSVALFADFLGLGDTFRSIICAVSMNEDVQRALSEATSSLLMLVLASVNVEALKMDSLH
ncbi:Uncharacterized protein Rs2_04150 [Raphanus sativus]|nr:Uncharacterized protein Rs2_04150 [Raphanus sativus]